MKYNIERKVVYVCPKTGRRRDTRLSTQDIKFDSTAEYNCYKMLCSLLPQCDVLCQYPVDILGVTRWNCDFCIVAKTRQAFEMLGYVRDILTDGILTGIGKETLLLEYKGVIDDNFRGKMETLAKYDTELFSDITVLSNEPMALHIEVLSKLESHVKVIHSTDFFRKVIEVYNNGK